MKNTVVVDARMITSSGIGTVVANVLPRLIARRPDWRFRLVGSPATLAEFPWVAAAGVDIVPFAPRIYSLREQLGWPVGTVRNADAVWSPHYNMPLRWPGRLLVTVHDVAHLAQPDLFRGVKRLYARGMLERVRHRADGIVFDSQFTADEFGRRVGEPRNRARVVPCGVGEDWRQIAPCARHHAGPYILYVGNVKPHKNLKRLLHAFGKVMAEIPHDLLIVGKKEGFLSGDNEVEGMVEAFGGRVLFTGFVEDEILKRLVVQADAFVFPSYYEGFGLPPLEAMAAGCPTIVSHAASLPEVCGDATVYFDPFDIDDMAAKLRRVLADEALREKLREAGRRRAAELTWDRTADGYLEEFAAMGVA